MCARDGWSQRNGIVAAARDGRTLSFPPRMEREVAVPGFLTVRLTRVTQYF